MEKSGQREVAHVGHMRRLQTSATIIFSDECKSTKKLAAFGKTESYPVSRVDGARTDNVGWICCRTNNRVTSRFSSLPVTIRSEAMETALMPLQVVVWIVDRSRVAP